MGFSVVASTSRLGPNISSMGVSFAAGAFDFLADMFNQCAYVTSYCRVSMYEVACGRLICCG